MLELALANGRSVCPSVRLSVRHSRDTHQNGPIYRNMFHTLQ